MASLDDKFNNFSENLIKRMDEQDNLLEYIIARLNIQDQKELIKEQQEAYERNTYANRMSFARRFENYNRITEDDNLLTGAGKSAFAFLSQLNPITALIYQNAGLLGNTLSDVGKLAGNALLGAKNLFNKGQDALSGLFKSQQTNPTNNDELEKLLPAVTGSTAVGFLRQKDNATQSISGLDNLHIDKVTNLKIDNTAAAQLKIHQAMIWADQAVIIPNNNSADTPKNIRMIEDKTKINERLLPPPSSETKTEKVTRQLSEGVSGLTDSLKKSTEAVKNLTVPLLWVGLGIGALVAAILGLKALIDIRNNNAPDKADQLRDMSQKAQAGSDTVATGTNISSMNSGTISDVIQKLWNGKFNGKIGESNSAFWDYGNNAVNSVTYGTDRGKRTPVIIHFDGTIIGITPMSNMKTPQFEIAVERDNFFRGMASNTLIGKMTNKDNGYSNKNIVVFRGVIEPLVKINQHVPKGYVIGYSDGAVTLVGENTELLNDYLSDINEFTDNNYAKAADITKSELDRKTSLFGSETMSDSINKAHTQMALDLASDAANYEDKAIDTESPWWLSAIRKADKWNNTFHGDGMTTDITDTGSLINKFVGTPTGGAASITDNVSKNSVEVDNNANKIISSNVQNNSNGYSGEVPSYDKLSATAKNPEIGTIEFGLMDDNDIAMVCGQYSDVGLKI